MAVVETEGRTAARQGRRPSRLFRNLTAKTASIPMIATVLVIFVGCTLWTVIYSFTKSRLLPVDLFTTMPLFSIPVPMLLASDGSWDFSLITGLDLSNFVGLDQYERLWGTNRWTVSIGNLAIFGVCSMTFSLVIGFTLAALMDRKIRFENAFRTIFLYPFALSFIVTGLVWQWILNPDFGVQKVVRDLGWQSFTFDPLYNESIVIYGILIAGLWQGTGLVMCLMLAGIRGIDDDIWKASRVDGIPVWKTYVMIVIPMMRPVFVTSVVIIGAGIVKVYDLVVAQTSGGPGIASQMPALYVMDKMFLSQNLAQGFAASTMMLLAVAIVLIPWAYFEFGSKKRG
jgi:glucose/mannose transport system permease protein